MRRDGSSNERHGDEQACSSPCLSLDEPSRRMIAVEVPAEVALTPARGRTRMSAAVVAVHVQETELGRPSGIGSAEAPLVPAEGVATLQVPRLSQGLAENVSSPARGPRQAAADSILPATERASDAIGVALAASPHPATPLRESIPTCSASESPTSTDTALFPAAAALARQAAHRNGAVGTAWAPMPLPTAGSSAAAPPCIMSDAQDEQGFLPAYNVNSPRSRAWQHHRTPTRASLSCATPPRGFAHSALALGRSRRHALEVGPQARRPSSAGNSPSPTRRLHMSPSLSVMSDAVDLASEASSVAEGNTGDYRIDELERECLQMQMQQPQPELVALQQSPYLATIEGPVASRWPLPTTSAARSWLEQQEAGELMGSSGDLMRI
mmetsp:Transcript_16694/g.42910  ORF Transcript_16694/g.42910 Transcript_16694/m.42910 type:complete len:383 (-) Transcript_16694:254-1402(-)